MGMGMSFLLHPVLLHPKKNLALTVDYVNPPCYVML
jgi:hypothetical protein